MLARQLHHHPAWSRGRAGRRAGRGGGPAGADGRPRTSRSPPRSTCRMPTSPRTSSGCSAGSGCTPAPTSTRYAAAALDGTDLAAARRGLEALYDQYLLTEPAPGRYRMHDLVREHARALAGRLDPVDDRDAGHRPAAGLLPARRRPRRSSARPPGPQPPPAAVPSMPAVVPDLAGREQALAWARAERASLLACLDHATEPASTPGSSR